MVASLAMAERLPAQCNYEVTAVLEAPVNCGILGPANTFATAINDHGVVTGYYDCLSNPRPFIWSEEMGFVLIPLPPGVSDATPADINNDNEIVGTMNRFSSGAEAFSWKVGVWTVLPSLPELPESHAYGISDNGEIVGDVFNSFTGPRRAVRWRNGTISPLDLPIGPSSAATDVNVASTIVGWMGNGGSGDSTGFVSERGTITQIPPLVGGNRADPAAINAQGIVIGVTRIPVKSGPVRRRSWLFRDGRLTDLGSLAIAEHSTNAANINDAIQIVGTAINPPPPTSVSIPFFWQHDTIRDLRSLVIGVPDNLTLRSAEGINETGQIIGGALIGSRLVAVVLSPIDRPLGDVNIDCAVDEHDLIAVLEDWGPNKDGHTTDIVTSATFAPPSDGRVDGADLAVVLGNWAPTLQPPPNSR